MYIANVTEYTPIIAAAAAALFITPIDDEAATIAILNNDCT